MHCCMRSPPATCHLSSVCSDIPAIIWPSNIMQAEKASHESCHVWLVLFEHFSSSTVSQSVSQSVSQCVFCTAPRYRGEDRSSPLVSSRLCAIVQSGGREAVVVYSVQCTVYSELTTLTVQRRALQHSTGKSGDQATTRRTKYQICQHRISLLLSQHFQAVWQRRE